MTTTDKNNVVRRRGSYDIIKQESKTPIEGFPRRHSYAPKPAAEIQVRRHSEISLPEIQQVRSVETTKRSKMCRRYSMINAPKVLNERPSKFKENEYTKFDKGSSKDDLMLPRIPSVTPEPEIIRRMSYHTSRSDVFVNEFSNGSYMPKHCWCLRCQLMFAMFKAGDDRLEMWGNYPCFRR